jgi:cell division protein FtsZ
VVATGIDHVATTARPAETRPAEAVSKKRMEAQRIAPVQPPIQVAAPAPAPVQAAAAPAPAPRPSVHESLTAAVAAALAPDTAEDVTVRPITPKPSLFVEPVMTDPAPEDLPRAFIPPEPERVTRAPRMPRLEDLPMPAQNEIRASRGELPDPGPEKQRLSLLQRLAQVGLGRRDDGAAHEEAPAAPQLPPLPPRMPQPAMPVSEYAKRPPSPAPQGLDIHGRQTLPVQKSVDDDQLEIPAFLRRQAN